jgi:hypothetical protein
VTPGEARERYEVLLRQVKDRIDLASSLLSGSPSGEDIERSALHLQLVLELLVLSSLVTRQEDLERVASNLRNKDANEAWKLARTGECQVLARAGYPATGRFLPRSAATNLALGGRTSSSTDAIRRN